MRIFFILIILYIVTVYADESKYIDLLPEKEKVEFLEKIARRILEEIQTKDDRPKESSEIPDEQLNEHDAFIQKIMQEESDNLRRQTNNTHGKKENNNIVRILPQEQEETKGSYVDLTLRTDKNRTKRESDRRVFTRLSLDNSTENVNGESDVDIQVKNFRRRLNDSVDTTVLKEVDATTETIDVTNDNKVEGNETQTQDSNYDSESTKKDNDKPQTTEVTTNEKLNNTDSTLAIEITTDSNNDPQTPDTTTQYGFPTSEPVTDPVKLEVIQKTYENINYNDSKKMEEKQINTDSASNSEATETYQTTDSADSVNLESNKTIARELTDADIINIDIATIAFSTDEPSTVNNNYTNKTQNLTDTIISATTEEIALSPSTTILTTDASTTVEETLNITNKASTLSSIKNETEKLQKINGTQLSNASKKILSGILKELKAKFLEPKDKSSGFLTPWLRYGTANKNKNTNIKLNSSDSMDHQGQAKTEDHKQQKREKSYEEVRYDNNGKLKDSNDQIINSDTFYETVKQFDKSRPRVHQVFEISPDESPFIKLNRKETNSLKSNSRPKLQQAEKRSGLKQTIKKPKKFKRRHINQPAPNVVPVYNYLPKNAFFNPQNIYGPMEEGRDDSEEVYPVKNDEGYKFPSLMPKAAKKLTPNVEAERDEEPYYVPVYYYSPKNAHYNPKNVYGPDPDSDENQYNSNKYDYKTYADKSAKGYKNRIKQKWQGDATKIHKNKETVTEKAPSKRSNIRSKIPTFYEDLLKKGKRKQKRQNIALDYYERYYDDGESEENTQIYNSAEKELLKDYKYEEAAPVVILKKFVDDYNIEELLDTFRKPSKKYNEYKPAKDIYEQSQLRVESNNKRFKSYLKDSVKNDKNQKGYRVYYNIDTSDEMQQNDISEEDQHKANKDKTYEDNKTTNVMRGNEEKYVVEDILDKYNQIEYDEKPELKLVAKPDVTLEKPRCESLLWQTQCKILPQIKEVKSEILHVVKSKTEDEIESQTESEENKKSFKEFFKYSNPEENINKNKLRLRSFLVNFQPHKFVVNSRKSPEEYREMANFLIKYAKNGNRNEKEVVKDIVDYIRNQELRDIYMQLEEIEQEEAKKVSYRSKKIGNELDPYAEVLGDMLQKNNKALEQYDWLGTTVDLLTAIKKMSDMVESINIEEDIHPSDLQLLKYIVYLHTHAQEEVTQETTKNTREKRGIIIHGQRPKHVVTQPGLLLYRGQPATLREGSEDPLHQFKNFLDDLQTALYDLHTALKYIAMVTTYKNQRWFESLKEIHIETKKKPLLEVILHLSTARLLGLIEESAEDGVEDDYKDYVKKNEKEVEKTKKEFVFVLKLLDEIKRTQ